MNFKEKFDAADLDTPTSYDALMELFDEADDYIAFLEKRVKKLEKAIHGFSTPFCDALQALQ